MTVNKKVMNTPMLVSPSKAIAANGGKVVKLDAETRRTVFQQTAVVQQAAAQRTRAEVPAPGGPPKQPRVAALNAPKPASVGPKGVAPIHNTFAPTTGNPTTQPTVKPVQPAVKPTTPNPTTTPVTPKTPLSPSHLTPSAPPPGPVTPMTPTRPVTPSTVTPKPTPPPSPLDPPHSPNVAPPGKPTVPGQPPGLSVTPGHPPGSPTALPPGKAPPPPQKDKDKDKDKNQQH